MIPNAPGVSQSQGATTCQICRTVPDGDLIELDLLMGDASRWPSTIWGIFDPPKGRLTPARTRWGSVEMGRIWLEEHGYKFSDRVIRTHYRYDVVVIAASVEDLIARGLIAKGSRRHSEMTVQADAIDPKAFLTFFDRGIKLGNRGLELMAARLEELIEKKETVPFALLKEITAMGAKLATTQASIKARGQTIDDAGDEEEGFRIGSTPPPSQRVGHNRVRVIEGEARPVADEGPKDREHYNARAREEGSPEL